MTAIADFFMWISHVHDWSPWKTTTPEGAAYAQQERWCRTCGLLKTRID